MSNYKKIIVVMGPTASGKTSLSIKLARKFNGEIISADSRQVYKGMNVGTGKATKKEMQGIKHYLLDVASPKKIFSVARYQRLALQALHSIFKGNKTPIIVGGTGFYIDALLYNYTLPPVKPNPALRKNLEKKSTQKLFELLKEKDLKTAQRIDKNNPRRLIRALEIVISTKKPIPALNKKEQYNALKIGIILSQQELKKRIKKRLHQRIKIGMIQEVKKLHSNGVSWKRLDNFGLEYRYITRYLQGLLTKKEMLEILEKEIERYAKRQMTWFKRDKDIKWISNLEQANKLAEQFLQN